MALSGRISLIKGGWRQKNPHEMELVTHKTALTQTTDDNGDIGPLADGWQERGTARPLLRNGPAEIKRDPT